ncbi:MAG: hypothetical protein QW220_01130 [Candidatus Bathyarchaeia archaeon]
MGLQARKRADEELEAALSPGRLKIMRVLLKSPHHAFTRYELGKKTPLRPIDIREDLALLVRMGWVKELPYEPRKYTINLENEKVRHLADFLRKVGYL